ncbi:MAG: hypothetical protein HY791_13870 [Deltaproteobacteria bacterium]|nr:hypothetical protein [Deltaproteobacteria bacterium]
MQNARSTDHQRPAPSLDSWLRAVNTHIEKRKVERQALPRQPRNRDRERARREARQLFREYEQELALMAAMH